MNRQYIQIEIGNLARVCSQNAQGLGHYTPTPPLGASNGIEVEAAAECSSKAATAVQQPVAVTKVAVTVTKGCIVVPSSAA